MARKIFLNWLFSQEKKPLYIDSTSGFVLEGNTTWQKPDGQPACLKHDPVGWKDALVKYARNDKSMGLFRSMTVAMKFPADGAKILRNRMWMFGIECICYFGMSKLDRLNFPPTYKSWYMCEIDFTKYRQVKGSVIVNAMEGGPTKYLKANENTQYEIGLSSDTEVKKAYLDGQDFEYNAEFNIFRDSTNIASPQDFEQHLPELFLSNVEAGSYGTLQPVTMTLVDNVNSNIRATGMYFVKASTSGTAKFDYNFDILVNSSNPGAIDPSIQMNFVIRGINQSNATSFEYVMHTRTGSAMLGAFTVSGTTNLTVTKNDELYLYVYVTPLLNNNSGITVEYTSETAYFKMAFVYLHPPTTADCLYPYRLGTLLIEKMTEGKYGFKSDFFLNFKNTGITCGDALRGQKSASADVVLDKSVIKTSFSDFMKFGRARYMLGHGIEGDNIVVEPFTYFLRPDLTVMNLGEINGLEVSIAEEFCGNTIKAGYKEQEYKDVNGKYEVNQGQIWSAPITKIINEIDITCPYRADPIGIELLRINFGTKRTSDTAADNETFILDLETTPDSVIIPGTDVYHLNRPAYSSVSGLLNSTNAYNIELSPKRGLLANGPFLHSIMDFEDSLFIKQTKVDKNGELSTTLSGVTIAEKANIQVGSLDTKLFRPYFFQFKTEVPFDYLTIMAANPYGLIYFTYNGIEYSGYMWDGGIKPGNNDVQEWKLLCGPDVDLKKLIDNG